MLHCSFSAAKTLSTQGFLEKKMRGKENPRPSRERLSDHAVFGRFQPPKRQINGTGEQANRNQANHPVWRNLPPVSAEATHNRIAQELPPLYSPLGRVRASHSTGHGTAASCLLLLGGRKPCTHFYKTIIY